MKEFYPIFRACPLFSGIEEEELTALLGCLEARPTTFHRQETIFSEGDPARYVGLVLSGEVLIVREDYGGNRSIMTHLCPGQLFGESFACAGVESLPVSAVAATESTVLLMDCRRLMFSCGNACAFHHRLIFNLMRIMAGKNLLFHRKTEIISRRTTRERLMTYLMLEAKERGAASFTIPFDRQGLADYLEVDRSGLSAEIGKLRKEGLLASRKSSFTLLPPFFSSGR